MPAGSVKKVKCKVCGVEIPPKPSTRRKGKFEAPNRKFCGECKAAGLHRKKHFCQICKAEVTKRLRKDRPGQFGNPPKYCDSCRSLQNRGKNNNRWKGGETYSEGYRYVLDPQKQHLRGLSRYSLEHRLVVEQSLGRQLEKDEIVHHLNGIRTDNRIENLEVIKKSPDGKSNHETWTLNRALAQRIQVLEQQIALIRAAK